MVFFWQSSNDWLVNAGVTEHQLLCLANKIPVRDTWAPSLWRRAESSPQGQWPCCSTHLIPGFTASRLSDGSPLCGKHKPSGQSLPAACAPSQRHTAYNPLYSLAAPTPRSLASWTGSEQERAWVTTRMPPFRDENNRAHSPAACRPLRQHSDEREATKINLCCWVVFFFYRKLQGDQGSSGDRCRRWERSCCHKDVKNKSLLIGNGNHS